MTTASDQPVFALALELAAAGPTAPTEIMVMPAGQVQTAATDPRGPWLCDPAAVVAASRTERPMVIDFDHATDLAAPRGEPAPAAGWITQLHARPDGVWATVEWTAAGAQVLADRQWRFLSPVFITEGRTVRRILRASLVNNPAIPALPQLAAAALTHLKTEQTMPDDFLRLASALGCAETGPVALTLAAERLTSEASTMRAALHAVSQALALPNSTSGEVLCAAIATRVPKSDLDEATKKLAAAEQKLAAAEAQALLAARTQRVEALLTAGKITPAQREATMQICAALSEDAWKAYAEGLPVLAHVRTYQPTVPTSASPAGDPLAQARQIADAAQKEIASAAQGGVTLSVAEAVARVTGGQNAQ